MKTVLQDKDNALHSSLYIAFVLSAKKWKLGFSNGDKHRIKTVDAIPVNIGYNIPAEKLIF